VQSSPGFSDTFDALPLGALANGTDGWSVTSTGNAVNVVATPSATDKSVELVRGANTGGAAGTNLTRAFSGGLTGTVTVEADVMRGSGSSSSGADYFALPYLYNSAGAQAVSVAFSGGEIQAYEGTSLHSLEPFTAGTWYHVKLVVNTSSQTFDLYIDGRQEVSAAAFRTSAASISSLAFYANSSNFGSAYVNNVIVH